jgi:hypothetical protein
MGAERYDEVAACELRSERRSWRTSTKKPRAFAPVPDRSEDRKDPQGRLDYELDLSLVG